jgi:hypothetical protein
METTGARDIIGSVISDEESPSFEIFRFKAKHDKHVAPGTLVAVAVSGNSFLVARVSASHEYNPHESSSKVTVRDALDISPDYPTEEISLTIHRLYEAEIIDEVRKRSNGTLETIPPQSLVKSSSEVFVPPIEAINAVIGLEVDPNKSLDIGNLAITLAEEGDIAVRLKREIIQRHVFIGGTTGSGKSYAARVLAEEIHKHKIPIIFFDTQYEFVPIAKQLGGVVLEPGKSYQVKLSSLTPDEMTELIPTLKHDLHVDILTNAFLRLKEINRPFTNHEFLSQIDAVSDEMGQSPAQRETTKQIVHKRTEYHLKQYDFLGNSFDWISIIKPSSVINIDCKGVDRRRLQLILAATLRELQTLRKDGKIPPYVIFVDEAHLFVPQDEESACKQIIREGVRTGRHFGMVFVLITQSPLDIDKKAIRQCNTRFLFAIEPDQLQAIQGVKADATQEMVDKLPKAPVGTCIVSGTYETIKHAIPVRIRKMETPEADAGKAPDIFAEVGG